MINKRNSKFVLLSIYIVIVIAVLLFSNVFTDFTSLPIFVRYSNATYSDQNNNSIALSAGDSVEQAVKINQDNTSSLTIYYSDNFGASSLSNIRIVSSEENSKFYNAELSVNEEESAIIITPEKPLDSGNYVLSFDVMSDIKLKSAASMDTILSVKINGNKANLCIETTAKYPGSAFLFIMLMLMVVIIPSVLIIFTNKVSAKSFIIYAVLFVMLFIVVLPYPFNDEEHYTYYTANSLNLNVFSKQKDNTVGSKSTWLPSGVLNTTSILHNKSEALSEDYTEYTVSHDGYDLQLQFQYIPIFIAGRVAMITGMSHYGSVILCRIITAMIYITLCALALHFAGKYKYIIYIIAASPLLLIKASSMSANAIVIAFAMFIISICLRCIYDSEFKLNVWHIVMLAVSVFAIASYKYLILIPITFLVFAIPGRSYTGKTKTISSWIFGVVIIASIGLQIMNILKNPEIVARCTETATGTITNNSFISTLQTYITEIGSSAANLFGAILAPYATDSSLIIISSLSITVCMCLACILTSRKDRVTGETKEYKQTKVKLTTYILLAVYVLVIGSYIAHLASGDQSHVFVYSLIQMPVIGLILMILAHCASRMEHDTVFAPESHITGALTLFSGCTALCYLLTAFGCL